MTTHNITFVANSTTIFSEEVKLTWHLNVKLRFSTDFLLSLRTSFVQHHKFAVGRCCLCILFILLFAKINILWTHEWTYKKNIWNDKKQNLKVSTKCQSKNSIKNKSDKSFRIKCKSSSKAFRETNNVDQREKSEICFQPKRGFICQSFWFGYLSNVAVNQCQFDWMLRRQRKEIITIGRMNKKTSRIILMKVNATVNQVRQKITTDSDEGSMLFHCLFFVFQLSFD